MKNKHTLTQKTFEQVIVFAGADIGTSKIAELLKISAGSVSNIKKCKTWDNWKSFKKSEAERLRAKLAVKNTIGNETNGEVLGKFPSYKTVTKNGTVIDPSIVHEPQLDLFQRSLLNKLTEMTQVLSDLNTNLISKQTDTKKGWTSKW